MQGNVTAEVVQGFATILQIPTSSIASVTFSNSSQQLVSRSLQASSTDSSANVVADPTSSPASPSDSTVTTARQTVVVTIQPPITSASNQSAAVTSPLTAPTVARLLAPTDATQAQAALGFAVTQVTQTNRVGICGNGVCEVGERGVVSNGSQAGLKGSCPSDCPVQYSACPTGGDSVCSKRGTCLSSQGVCNCFPG